MTNLSYVENAEQNTIKEILQDIAREQTRCKSFVQAGRCEEAENALARARELYSRLIETADLENPIHRSIARNRRVDLATIFAEVEDCRLKQETERVRRAHKKTRA